MKIKKISEEVLTLKKSTRHTFLVGGKTVEVIDWTEQDNVQGEYDNGTDIEPENGMTEDDTEVFDQYITEILDLKVGEEYESN